MLFNTPNPDREKNFMAQLLTEASVFRLTVEGKMTFEFAKEIEAQILGAMHRYLHLEVDLSGVREIDLCGIHLLGLLRSFGDKRVLIVAVSPVVEQAPRRLLGSFRGGSLARSAS